MLFRRILLGTLAVSFTCLAVQAQLFETRSTRYSGDTILDKLKNSGNALQLTIRDSVLEAYTPSLTRFDTIETYYDDHNMGLVVYRAGKPHQLLGFWNPTGTLVNGGSLLKGSGTVKTPFNPSLIRNFKSESIVYVEGLKNGEAFYYCECASVLRKGTFVNNAKQGWWKEFRADGSFIRQERVKIPDPIVVTLDTVDIKTRDIVIKQWDQPAHCMIQIDVKCPIEPMKVKGRRKRK